MIIMPCLQEGTAYLLYIVSGNYIPPYFDCNFNSYSYLFAVLFIEIDLSVSDLS